MAGQMKLNRNFKEFLESLNKNHVKYLIVGGYAVAHHGNPRYTKDLDVWILGNPENAINMTRALSDFGFASLDLQADDFTGDHKIIQLGYPPLRIDILTSIDGVDFEACYARKLEVDVDGQAVWLIHMADLVENKLSSGRPQDLADAAVLKSR